MKPDKPDENLVAHSPLGFGLRCGPGRAARVGLPAPELAQHLGDLHEATSSRSVE